MMSGQEALVELSNGLGDPGEDLAILAEGNASTRCDENSFWIKASGFNLANLTENQIVQVSFSPYRSLPETLSDLEVKQFLADSCPDRTALMPSVETFMHAYLLDLPDVLFVGHTHPTPLISLLSLEIASELATKRVFPDEIVCCGPESAFVPYCDPGLPLARAIKESVTRYVSRWESVPKTIWLANHGLIAIGKTPQEVLATSRMSVKSARAWIGALSTGQALRELKQAEIERIYSRPDERYRQRILAATNSLG